MDKKVILDRIEQLMIEKGITKYQLKENVDISSTIYQWKKNATRDKDRVPSLRSIEKICKYLGVSLSLFFAFNESTQKNAEIQEIIELLEPLNHEQISLLKALVQQFKRGEID